MLTERPTLDQLYISPLLCPVALIRRKTATQTRTLEESRALYRSTVSSCTPPRWSSLRGSHRQRLGSIGYRFWKGLVAGVTHGTMISAWALSHTTEQQVNLSHLHACTYAWMYVCRYFITYHVIFIQFQFYTDGQYLLYYMYTLVASRVPCILYNFLCDVYDTWPAHCVDGSAPVSCCRVAITELWACDVR